MRDKLHRQYNLRDVTAIDDYTHENHVDHNPTPGQEQGKAGVRKLIQRGIDNGGSKVEIHEIITEGDMVCVRYVVTRTHTSSFYGLPAAGVTTHIEILGINRIEDEQLIESWGEFNALEVLGQLGADPGIQVGRFTI